MIERAKELLAEARLGGILHSLHYPITKEELITVAQEHNAPDGVVALLERLPEETFNSAMNVIENLRGHEETEKMQEEELEEGD